MYIKYVRGIVIDGGIPGDGDPSWPVYVYTGTYDYLSLGGPGGVGLPTRPRSVTNRPAMTRPPAAVRNRDAENASDCAYSRDIYLLVHLSNRYTWPEGRRYRSRN